MDIRSFCFWSINGRSLYWFSFAQPIQGICIYGWRGFLGAGRSSSCNGFLYRNVSSVIYFIWDLRSWSSIRYNAGICIHDFFSLIILLLVTKKLGCFFSSCVQFEPVSCVSSIPCICASAFPWYSCRLSFFIFRRASCLRHNLLEDYSQCKMFFSRTLLLFSLEKPVQFAWREFYLFCWEVSLLIFPFIYLQLLLTSQIAITTCHHLGANNQPYILKALPGQLY